MAEVAAIVLCGGASRRMGRSKADLPFGTETLLQRVVRQLSQCVGLVIVAAAPGQPLPEFDDPRVLTVRDPAPHRGPLLGMQAALGAVPSSTEFVYLAAVDVPQFSPTWLHLLVERISICDAAVPLKDGRRQPFAALYRVEPTRMALACLQGEGVCRLTALLDRLAIRPIECAEVRQIDPEDMLFQDLDHPEDYDRALEKMT